MHSNSRCRHGFVGPLLGPTAGKHVRAAPVGTIQSAPHASGLHLAFEVICVARLRQLCIAYYHTNVPRVGRDQRIKNQGEAIRIDVCEAGGLHGQSKRKYSDLLLY